MECTAWEEQISALADCELGDQEAGVLFSHLAGCRECRSFYGRVMRMKESMRDQADVVPHPTRMEPKLHVTASTTRTRPGRRATYQISRSVAIAAASLIIILGGTTASLVLEQTASEARVIYVIGLPTIEVEATYLPATNNKL